MKIFLSDQKKNLARHLEDLKKKSVMDFNKNLLVEKVTSIKIENQINNIDLSFFFNYKIFPNQIMSFLSEWELEKREMRIGDTIVQQVYLPPLKMFAQKVIFGVRINQIIDEPNKKGFSYVTLKGHVEKGISTFTIEQKDNKTLFKIHTFSEPGNLLTKIVAPIFSIPYQTFCTWRALKNVKSQIEK